MSEYGELESHDGSAGLSEAHADSGGEHDFHSQYGILEHDHHHAEHTEFDHIKHIEFTDAAGNHYEETEIVHYEHTEIEDDHTFAAFGETDQHSLGHENQSGLSEAATGGGDAGDTGQGGFGVAEADGGSAALHSLTARFESFLGDVLDKNGYEISDSSA